MDELMEWLEVQLSVDEQIAQDAAHFEAGNWTTEDGYPVSVADELPEAADTFERVVVFDEGSPSTEQARHIAEWDPARVLREVDAKRQLLNDHPIVPRTIEPTVINGEEIGGPHFPFGCQNCHAVHDTSEVYGFGYCFTVKVLALPYADRPGYREEWRP